MHHTVVLDFPTLIFATVCLAVFLGVFLIANWVKQRDIGALAWWGSAYLIGAAAIMLWGAPDQFIKVPSVLAEAMIFVACGMFWNGLRLFYGRRMWPLVSFAGAIAWVLSSPLHDMEDGSPQRVAFGVLIVAIYTFGMAFELSRERRRSLYSRTATIAVPLLHASIFLLPLALRYFFPDAFATRWQAVFAVEALIYTVGTAFIVLLMVKDRHVHFYRKIATTDHLTGLLNRGAFLEAATSMHASQSSRGEPVTLLMFDLDRFKSINDRFGHAVGDSALKVFAKVLQESTRATDVVGRLGGEEFVAMVPEAAEDACIVAERLRVNFQAAGVTIDNIAIGATVSTGLATTYKAETTLDSLLLRADEALYRAKNGGRNRYICADEEPGSEPARARWAARARPEAVKSKWAGRRPKAAPAAAG
ncbi:GGDEF domain-containing protein [Undibacter mobilis]|uniref:diguanylate cyclase n=1 Tax=Undibacter mobilis TaxID=2292256 RepID=A0A371B147_9BRAD|nr:GGDEF domain-containing protein [Undibacter mobilis]RDV01309.1 GGDEF domain-containing protein [Undibacter mobilis]